MPDGRADGMVPGFGRLTPGNIVTDKAGNVVEHPKDAGKPTFTADDLAHIDSDAADLDDELDAEFAERARALKKLGADDEEIRRHTGDTKPTAPAVSKASLQSRLDEIRGLRKTDQRAYYSQAVQAEELALIEALQDGKTDKAPASEQADVEVAPTASETKLDSLRAELEGIQERRLAGRKAYDKDEAIQLRERELLDQIEVVELSHHLGESEDVVGQAREMWAAQGGTEACLGHLAGFAKTLSASMSDADREAFGVDYGKLPDKVRLQAMAHFGASGGSLSARFDLIEKSLSGSDLSAAKAFRARWGEKVAAGLVR